MQGYARPYKQEYNNVAKPIKFYEENDLISAATLARTRSQNETSNKTHPPFQSIRPSALLHTPKLFLNVRESQDELSSSEEHVSDSTQQSLVRSLDSLVLHQQLHQQYQHGKPSVVDVNLIIDDPSQLTVSTEAPPMTTITDDHYYATIQRSNYKKRSILDPPNMPSRYQSDQDEEQNDDYESVWSTDGEEEEEEDYGVEYDLPDFSQPNHQLIVDLSMEPATNGFNQNDPNSQVEEDEEEADEDDVILVVGQLTTLKPTTNSYEKELFSAEHTTQSNVEQQISPTQVIGLNEWPVQIGLQARPMQPGSVNKLADSQMGNENGRQTFLEAQKFNGQQWENRSVGSSNFQVNSERLDISKSSGSVAESRDDSALPYFVHSQFMNSPVTNSYMASKQMNKTKPPEISLDLLEIVDGMTNHYGNPRQTKPTTVSSTASVPEILRDWSDSSEDQIPTTTAEPDEPFYYINSEEETDQDFDYPEENEDDAKSIIRITQNAEIINSNSATENKLPLTTSMGRPPYFVNSAQLEPFHPKIDLSDETGQMLNPIGVIDRRMDLHSYNGINFGDPPDLIDGSAFIIPFPDDPVIPFRPSLNLNLQQQQQQTPTIFPLERKENFQENNNFAVTSNRVQPFVQQPKVITGPNSVSPSTNKAGAPYAYVTQEEIISQHPTEMKNSIQERSSYSAMASSSRLTSVPSQSVKSDGVLRIPMDDDNGVTFTPIPTRPFAQSPHVTWATTKARYGPYFVSSAPTNQQHPGNYNTEQGIRKQAIETIKNPTGIISDKEIEKSKSTSVNRGQPPYFVTSSTPTPLFQPTQLKESTRKPTDIIKTPVNEQAVANNQGTTTRLRPEETKKSFNFVTSDPIQTSPRPQPPHPTISRPIELIDSSSESDEMEQILDIGLIESVGVIPNPIGISNKKNVVVVPKHIISNIAQAPSATFKGDLKQIPLPSKLNTSIEQPTITTMIVNHGMGSFVVTSPVPFSAQQMVTHPSKATITATVKPPNVINSYESENTSYKFDKNSTVAEMEKTTGIVQNPIGISNKNNVFVVPKSASSIIRPPILPKSFPVDLLIMKRHGLVNDKEQQMLRPVGRVVNHQMGSFVVTTNPINQSFTDPADFIQPDTTTTASIESPFFIGSVEPVQQIGINNPEEKTTSKPIGRVVQKPIGIGNSKTVVRSPPRTPSASSGRPPYFAKGTTAEPFQPVYLNQHSMSKLVEEISKLQRGSDNGNSKGNIDPSVGLDVVQPSLNGSPTGRFMKPTLSRINNQQQRAQKTSLRRPSGKAGSPSNLLSLISVSQNITRQPDANLSPGNKTPKNPATKSSNRKTQ
ncbi:hypothetical protein DAPPUDRAFT_333100 [Daphnia pulex]|uniref:Uncharacterized protein n=1 Tax=Daphnia pulex TaxID=6669 RepID=E9HRV2_DAPPU|nr:hypothetical protein DAPPUDRAFT_333100 [Daphnia pulex]|eukprot:EFX65531.1 hypothetical protein DAPPUDRAFT_333100 [Daphnia pulex]